MINSNQTLEGARQIQAWDEQGKPIQTYDDGFGPLWLYREAGGLEGIVRAQSWHDAYECCQDEIMTRVSAEDQLDAYGFYIMEQNGRFWACPDVEVGEARWHTFEGIPSRNTIGSFKTRPEAESACWSVIQDNELDLIEGYEYQSNGTGTGIVTFDLNGQNLVELTPELASELEIVVQVTEG